MPERVGWTRYAPAPMAALDRATLGLGSRVPLASVVVPTWNGAHLLDPCLRSLAAQTYPHVEVIVADGASTDATAEVVGGWPGVRLLRLPRNRGFAGNVNAGLRAARGEVLLLLNNDAEAEPEWVGACVEALRDHPRAGSVASKMLYPDGHTLNTVGDGLTRDGRPFQHGSGQPDGPAWCVPREVLGASGGAAAYRRAMLADVGLLDEWFFAYLEDLDLALRAQARGWGCRFEPAARVRHRGSATGGGPLASYLNGRNGIRLLARNLPAGLLGHLLPGIARQQARRALDAARAWRGRAARATLRGQCAGLATLPLHLRARRAVQARRTISDAQFLALLSEAP